MKIHTIIFNWRGQHNKTLEKIEQLKAIGVNPTVINSDEGFFLDDWHNIGEESYFTAQFLKAIDVFDGDVLFHIQGDASYNNWVDASSDCQANST